MHRFLLFAACGLIGPNATAADLSGCPDSGCNDTGVVTESPNGRPAVLTPTQTKDPTRTSTIPQRSEEPFQPESGESPQRAPAAEERDLFTLGLSATETSDPLTAHDIFFRYRSARREWYWPWEEAPSRGPDWGLDIDGERGEYSGLDYRATRMTAMVGDYVGRSIYLRGFIGKHRLDAGTVRKTIHPYRLTGLFGAGRALRLRLETSRDFIYRDGAVPGGITEQLTARNYNADVRWRALNRVRLSGKALLRDYDDSNRSREEDLTALYGISPDWPWIWAGIGWQRLKYDEEVPQYWSPSQFTAYGLRFEGEAPITDRLSGNAGFNYDRIEEDGAKGKGHYLALGLEYRLPSDVYVRFNVERVDSIQRGSDWWQRSYFLRVSGPLL